MIINGSPLPASDAGMLSTAPVRPGVVTSTADEWRGVTVTQRNVSSMAEQDSSRTLASLEASIVKALRSIGEKWMVMQSELNLDVYDTPLPAEFADINRLAARVKAGMQTQGGDTLDLDSLIRKFEGAMARIYRSRQLPWGTWRSVGSQRTIASVDALTPHARSAFETLTHLENVLVNIRMTLDAVSNAASQYQAIPDEATPSAQTIEQRKNVAQAFATVGQLMIDTAKLAHLSLQKAPTCMPRDRRRWKTRIGVIAALAALSAALAVAAVLLPPVLPALVGLGLALKFGSTFVGILSAIHSVFSVIGYSRNRGWTELATCIERVRHTCSTMYFAMGARQLAAGLKETNEMSLNMERFSAQLTNWEQMQTAVMEKLAARAQYRFT